MSEPGKTVAKFVDESMFVAEPTIGREPKVTLIAAPVDPLGQIAQLAMMYQGKAPRSLREISDEDRRYYMADGKKNVLGMPSEAIVFHFLIENVTRSYTHQLVRTRHASYAQESLRFAVKEDFPTALPPHLVGTRSIFQEATNFANLMGWAGTLEPISADRMREAMKTVRELATGKQLERFKFDERNDLISEWYLEMIANGWPAEDARGILPHWILTKVNMVISLSSLRGMAGKRLCTQAQFEHRQVWMHMIQAIREYGIGKTYEVSDGTSHRSTQWQYELLAREFMPVCYQTGSCQFESDFDRFCNIRDRVQANAKIGRPSSEWGVRYGSADEPLAKDGPVALGIPAINPSEWLRPDAAIAPTGDWRSETAQENIKDRRL